MPAVTSDPRASGEGETVLVRMSGALAAALDARLGRRRMRAALTLLAAACVCCTGALAGDTARSADIVNPHELPEFVKARKDADAAAARRARTLAVPAARAERKRSRTAHRGLSADEAHALARRSFPGLLTHGRDTAGLLPDQDVRKLLSPNTAVIDDQGQRAIVVTNAPLAKPDGQGGLEPVDNTLHAAGERLVPEDPVAPVRLGASAAEEARLVGTGLGFAPAVKHDAQAHVLDGKAFYPNIATDTDYISEVLPDGVEASWILRSAAAPQDLRLAFALAAGQRLEKSSLGRIIVADDTGTVATVSRALAFDADGSQLAATPTIDGDDVVFHVDTSGDVHFPVLVDPQVGNYAWHEGSLDKFGWDEPLQYPTPNIFDQPFNPPGMYGPGLYNGAYGSRAYNHGDFAEWIFQAQGQSYIYRAEFWNVVVYNGGNARSYEYILRPFPTPAVETAGWCHPPFNGSCSEGSGALYETVNHGYNAVIHCARTDCEPVSQTPCASTTCQAATGHNRMVFGLYMDGATFPDGASNYMGDAVIYAGDAIAPGLTSWSRTYAGQPLDSNHWYTTTGSLQVSVTGHDDGLGIRRFQAAGPGAPNPAPLGCDGTPHARCPSDQPYGFSQALGEGVTPYSLQTFDLVSNASPVDSWKVKVDPTKPTLTAPVVSAEADGTRFGGEDYTVDVDAGDATSGVTSVTLQIDGDAPQVWTDTCAADGCGGTKHHTFTFTAPAAGSHTLKVIATDQAGNASDPRTVSFTSTAAAPGSNNRLGLEKFWDYDSVDTGGGSQLLVNAETGNLVWHDVPVVNPGRGLSTFLNLDYNSLDRAPRLGATRRPDPLGVLDPLGSLALADGPAYNVAGRGVSIGVSGPTRLDEPLAGVAQADVRDGMLGSVPGLPPDVGNQITLTDADGTRHQFTRDGTTQKWIAPPGVHLTLRRFANTGDARTSRRWVMTRPDGVAHFFNALGYLIATEDRNHNTLTYTYEYYDVLTGMSGAGAASCTMDKVLGAVSGTPSAANGWGVQTPLSAAVNGTAAGKLCAVRATKVTDPGGRDLTLAYESRVAADQTRLDQTVASVIAGGGSGLDVQGLLSQAGSTLTDLGALLAPPPLDKATDHAGRELTFDYAAGHLSALVEVANAGSLPPAGDQARRWAFDYLPTEDPGRPMRLHDVIEDRDAGEGGDRQTTVIYQTRAGTPADGETPALVPQTVTDRRGKATTYAFTAYGDAARTMTVTDARSQAWAHRVDAFGRPVEITDPLGNATSLRWDTDRSAGRHNDLNRLAEGVTKNTGGAIVDGGAVTTMAYEPMSGRVAAQTTYPDGDDSDAHRATGRTTTLTYAMSDGSPGLRPTAIPDPASGFVADLTDLKRPRTAPGSSTKVGWKFEVDSATGNVTSRQDQDGGPKAKTEYGSGGVVAKEIDELGNTTTYADFDASGLPQTVVDPLGNAIDGGNPTPEGHDPAAVSHRWLYRYDPVGNLLSVSDPRNTDATSAPAPGPQFTTRFGYDAFDRVLQSITPKDSAASAYVTENFTYDRNGNQLSSANPGTGRSTTAAFSETDQPLTVTRAAWSRNAAADGNSYQSRDEVTTFSYDDTDLLVSRTDPNGRSSVPSTGGTPDLPYTTEWVRDAAGRVVAEVRHAGAGQQHIRSLALDARGNVLGEIDARRNADPDGNGNQSDARTPAAAVSAAATAAAGPTSGYSALRVVRVFDHADELTRETAWPGPGDAVSVSQRTDYVYDADGNLSQRVLPRNFTDRPTGFNGTVAESYTYDHRDQLVETIDPFGAKTVQRRRADGLVTAITTPRGIADGTQSAATGTYKYFTQNFAYDAAGKLLSRTVPFAPGQYGRDVSEFEGWKVRYVRNQVGDPTTITDARNHAFANTFFDGGELKTTDRPSWWQLDWSGGGGAPDPGRRFGDPTPSDTPPLGGPQLSEREQPLTDGGAPGQGQPATTDQGKFGEVLAADDPDWLPRLGATALDWDDDGRLTRIQDAAGSSSRIDYDPQGRVVGTTQPLTDSAGATRTSGGDPQVCAGADASTNCAAAGKYPSDHRVIAHRYDYDLDGNRTIASQLGDDAWHTDSTYDSFDRLQSVAAPGSSDVPADYNNAPAVRQTTSYLYDANDNVTRRTTPRGLGYPYTYDSYDRLTREADAGGSAWGYTYDAGDNVVKEMPPNGFAAPAADQPNYQTLSAYDAGDRLATRQSPLVRTGTTDARQTTTYTYWPDSTLRRVSEPGAATVAGGTVVARLTEYDYDGRGLPSRETHGRASGTVFASGARTWLSEYDANGNLRRSVDPSGVTTATSGSTQTFTPTTADSLSVNLANPTAVVNHATIREYVGAPGDAGQVTNVWLPRSDTSDLRINQRFDHDALGRLSAVFAPGSATHTSYTHGLNGWIATAKDYRSVSGAPDALVDTATYKYDPQGNQTFWKLDHGASTDPDRTVVRNVRSHWPNGQLKRRMGIVGANGEDDPEQVNDTTAHRASYSYWYNKNGSLTGVRDTDHKALTAIGLDISERRIAVRQVYADPCADTQQHACGDWQKGRDSSFQYDRDGNVIERRVGGTLSGTWADTPAGARSHAHFTYDRADRETSQASWEPTRAGNPTVTDTTCAAGSAAVPNVRCTRSTYHPSNELESRRNANGTLDSTGYDEFGAPLLRTRKNAQNVQIKSNGFSYDVRGNRTADERGTYGFNARDQLTRWTRGSEMSKTNLSKVNTIVNYTLNDDGSLHTASDSYDSAVTRYHYTGERLDFTDTAKSSGTTYERYRTNIQGSTIEVQTGLTSQPADFTPGSGGTNADCDDLPAAQPTTSFFCYDEFNRLLHQRAAGSVDEQRFVYDGFDRRDRRRDRYHTGSALSGTTTGYTYVGASAQVAREKVGEPVTGYTTHLFDYDSAGAPLGVGQQKDNGTYQPFHVFATDVNGSVIGLEDATGNLPPADRYLYDPFGTLDPDLNAQAANGDSAQNPLRFEGFDYDSGVKTYAMQSRDYRPGSGRFLQADRYEAAGSDLNLVSDALTANRFAYAGGNPVNNIEFDGHRQDCVGPCPSGRAPTRSERRRGQQMAAADTKRANAPKIYNPDLCQTTRNACPRPAPVPKPKKSDGGVKGFVTGFGSGAVDTVKGGVSLIQAGKECLGNIIVCQYNTGKTTIGSLTHPRRTVDRAKNTLDLIVDDYSRGGGAQTAGRLTFDALTLALSGGAGAVAKGGRVARAAELAAETEGAATAVPKYARSQYGRPSTADRHAAIDRSPLCPYCGEADSTTADHITSLKQDWTSGGWADPRPVRTGRVNEESNLVGACRRCNSSKGAKPIGHGDGEWWPPGWGSDETWPFGP